MSWSIAVDGTPSECIEKARAKQEGVEAGLWEEEKSQVGAAIDAADTVLGAAVPEDAKVILNLSGSQSKSEGKVTSGSLGIGVSYQT